nr:reverse transcriptase domain-containing protein [Tanacetum cinerariifolium]
MADNRTMAELLQAPTEGYEEAIVILEIASNNFELKHAQIWLEKEPSRSILTWEDLVTKFINQFFPPSKTTNLRNEITRFQQRFDESFYEAWDHFNDLLRACPHHGFFELHQLDTFYNALNVNDLDSLNSVASGNFLDKMPRECLKIIKSKSKVRQSRAKAVVAKVSTSSSTLAISSEVSELKDMVRALLLYKKNQSSAPTSSFTPAPRSKSANPDGQFDGHAVKFMSSNTASSSGVPMTNLKPSIPYPSRRDNERLCDQVNEQIEKFYKIFKDMSFEISFTDALILMPKFASTLKALIGNKEKLSEMARTSMNEHCSAVILNKLPRKLRDPDKFLIPYTTASGNPTSYDDPIVSTTSPTLTLFGDSDFLLFEEADAFLEAFLDDDPSLPPPNQGNYLPEVCKELKICEAKSEKSSNDEPPEVELKDIPPHLEYAFLEGNDKLPVIIAKDLSVEEKTALKTVLKSHKRAIA